MSNITSVNESNFNQIVIENENLVLVDFWAEWCQPCKRIMPILEEFAKDHQDITIAKVNVDEARPLAAEYGIRGIPTILLFKHGEIVGTRVGELTKTELENFINEHN